MLFNSHAFIFIFLPLSLLGFFALAKISRSAAATWLCAASLAFYASWSIVYTSLLLASITFNYTLGRLLTQQHSVRPRHAKALLIFGISSNLFLLGYYKYFNFFISATNELSGTAWQFAEIILPLGISFYTFTQIAFLVDAHRGEAREYNPIHYGLFVTYFPHLIAGPILHHKEIMPQFADKTTYQIQPENIAVGLTLFFIGLYKKVVLADGIAPYVPLIFLAAGEGREITFFEAWIGTLAYTLQIYFDFSGYSDMAIGISRLFGIKLPLNFNSPYKSTSIIDFWRRWHMTLSRFLRDYLYIPLGGNRKGKMRRQINLILTMLLGGLWHGASWTYIIWGGLHGLYLAINHAWRRFFHKKTNMPPAISWAGRQVAWLLTFISVALAWIFFRAPDVHSAFAILKGISGLNGFILPGPWLDKLGNIGNLLTTQGIQAYPEVPKIFRATGWIIVLLTVALLMPNSQQIMARFNPSLDQLSDTCKKLWQWHPHPLWLGLSLTISVLGIVHLSRITEFLYYRF